MDIIFEEAGKLGNKIGFYATKHTNQNLDYDLISSDLNEGISFLHAEMFFHAKPGRYFSIDDPILENIARNYTDETGKAVEVENLIVQGLIRRVYGLIMLPQTTYTLINYAKKIIPIKDTFVFLSKTEKEQRQNPLTVVQLNVLAQAYGKDFGLTIDLDQAKTAFFWEEKDGLVSFKNLDFCQAIYERLESFLFLDRLYHIFYSAGDDNRLHIEKDTLKAIVDRHKQSYPTAPDLVKLLASNIIQETDVDYIILRFQSRAFHPDRIWDRTGAILWLKLRESSHFRNDADRLRFWYLRIIHRGDRCHIQGFVGGEDLLAFLNSAADAILNDRDLTFGEGEYAKLKLDHLHGRLPVFIMKPENSRGWPFPINDDLFILYKELLKFDHNGQQELFIIQSARKPLTFFIDQIVANEPETYPGNFDKSLVMKLLLQSASRPSLLWKVCEQISHHHPSLIPMLALHQQTASLGFAILWRTELSNMLEEQGNSEKLTLIIRYVEMVLENLATIAPGPGGVVSDSRKSEIICQCLLLPTLNQFFTPYGGTSEDRQKKQKYSSTIVKAIQELVESTQIQYSGRQKSKPGIPRLYPQLLQPLFGSIMAYTESDHLNNRTISLPFYKLDLLSWLLRLTNNAPSKDTVLSFDITKAFVETYLQSINQKEVLALEFGTDEFTMQLPSWTTSVESISLIDWSYCCLFMAKENLLDKFLDPKELVFIPTADRYDLANRFTADKLRSHLSILMLTFNGLYKNITELQAEGNNVTAVLNIIEYKITSIVTQHAIQDEKKTRVDIFDNLFERLTYDYTTKELIPTIGSTINKFSNENKRKIITELLRSDQLIRCLKLLESIVGEQDKQELLASIDTDLITREIDNTNWYEEQYILLQLVKHNKFRDKVREALTALQPMIREKKGLWREASLFTFRTKLLLAYEEDRPAEIDTIQGPEIESFHSQKINQASERDFYRALLLLKGDQPTEAYSLFNQWMERFETERPTWALNRFASKNAVARNIVKMDERRKVYFEAIKEWREFEKTVQSKTAFDHMITNVWYNQLEALNGAQLDPRFDKLYFELEKMIQLRPEFLELRIENYIRRNMHVQAQMLLNEAQQYHMLSDGNVPEFITKLREVAFTDKSEGYLRVQYDLIFSSPPETLVKIVHRNINKYDTLPLFILQELYVSAKDMLTFVNSISEIRNEDKYSDLLSLSLRGRLSNYSWSVGPGRGGYPESQAPNPGKIDFEIHSRSEKIAICEAMNLGGKNVSTQQTHNFKVFNYDPNRKFAYMIIYFLGERSKFQSAWEAYKENCASTIQFPAGFGISKPWEDLSEFSSDTIKSGKTGHGRDTIIYHLFINIEYLVNI